MKKLFLTLSAVFTLTAAILLVVFLFVKDGDGADGEGGAVDVPVTERESFTDESTLAQTDESVPTGGLGKLLEGCADVVKNGVYKCTVTRQRQIGGLSVPATTVTCYGDGFISVVEYEGHDIASEIFINADGAYYLNADLNTAYLLPADTAVTDTVEFEGLLYIESGSTVAGTSAYKYERYITPSGRQVDYLFAGGSLEKMKIYDGDGYELISINVSPDISGVRTSLPDGIEIIDDR